MSCNRLLRTQLNPSLPTGGVWYSQGYGTTLAGFDTLAPHPSNGIFTILTNGILSGGDDPIANINGADPGWYGALYLYDIGNNPCTFKQIQLIQVLDVPCSGGNNTATYCDNEPVVDLEAFFQQNSTCSNMGYNISNDNNANGFNSGNNTLDLGVTGEGVFSFTNTTTPSEVTDTDTYCLDCEQTSVSVITIVPNADPGSPSYSPESHADACMSSCITFNLDELLVGVSNNTSGQNGIWFFDAQYDPDTMTPLTYGGYFKIDSNGFQNNQPGSQIATGLTHSLTFHTTFSAVERIYRFKYLVNDKLPCEDYVYVDVYLHGDTNFGNFQNMTSYCWTDFKSTFLDSNGYPNADLTGFLDGTQNNFASGTWSMSFNTSSNYLAPFNLQNYLTQSNSYINSGVYDWSIYNDYWDYEVQIGLTLQSGEVNAPLCLTGCSQNVITENFTLYGGCDSGFSVYPQTTPYSYTGSTINLFDLGISNTGETCGSWELITTANNVLVNGSTLTNTVTGQAITDFLTTPTINRYNPLIDMSGAASGLYGFRYRTGSDSSPCTNTYSDVWIEVPSNCPYPCNGDYYTRIGTVDIGGVTGGGTLVGNPVYMLPTIDGTIYPETEIISVGQTVPYTSSNGNPYLGGMIADAINALGNQYISAFHTPEYTGGVSSTGCPRLQVFWGTKAYDCVDFDIRFYVGGPQGVGSYAGKITQNVGSWYVYYATGEAGSNLNNYDPCVSGATHQESIPTPGDDCP